MALRREDEAGRTGTATGCRVRRSVMQALVRKGYAVEADSCGPVVIETIYRITPEGILATAP